MMNSTSNFTIAQQSCPVDGETTLSTVFKTIAYCLVLLLSLVGNSAVIAIVYRDKKMRTITNYWITNMAVSDLIFPLVASPYKIAQIFTGNNVWLVKGDIGLALCKLTMFLGDVSTAISIQSMVFIAVERFCAVKFPLIVAALQPKMKLFIPMTWLLGFALHSPYFYTARLVSQGGKTFCFMSWAPAFNNMQAQRTYFLIFFALLYALPLALLIFLYTSIVVQLKKSKVPTWNNKKEIRERSTRKVNNSNILKMSVVVVLIFFLCFSPVIYLTHYMLFRKAYCISENVLFTVFFLVQSYPAWNPIVYFIFSNNFRNGLKNVLSKSSRPKRRYNTTLATSLSRKSFPSLRSQKLSSSRLEEDEL